MPRISMITTSSKNKFDISKITTYQWIVKQNLKINRRIPIPFDGNCLYLQAKLNQLMKLVMIVLRKAEGSSKKKGCIVVD